MAELIFFYGQTCLVGRTICRYQSSCLEQIEALFLVKRVFLEFEGKCIKHISTSTDIRGTRLRLQDCINERNIQF